MGAASALRGLHRGRAGPPRDARVTTAAVRVGPVTIGGGARLALIGGPCAIEDEKHALTTAERLAAIAADKKVGFIYKSSYDKANRSSVRSYRGPGLVEGLRILKKVRDTLGIPVLSDVHEVSEVAPAADVLDVGVAALFMEMHEDPDRTMADGQPLSDGPNMLRIDDLPRLLDQLRGIEQALRDR